MQSTFRHNTSAAAAAEWAQDGIYRNRTTSGARLALSSVAGTRHYDLWYCRAVACVSLSSLPFFWNTDLFFVIFLSPLVILFPLVLLIEISANVAVCASAFASSEDVCSAWLLNFRRLLLLFFRWMSPAFFAFNKGRSCADDMAGNQICPPLYFFLSVVNQQHYHISTGKHLNGSHNLGPMHSQFCSFCVATQEVVKVEVVASATFFWPNVFFSLLSIFFLFILCSSLIILDTVNL